MTDTAAGDVKQIEFTFGPSTEQNRLALSEHLKTQVDAADANFKIRATTAEPDVTLDIGELAQLISQVISEIYPTAGFKLSAVFAKTDGHQVIFFSRGMRPI